MDSVEEKHSSSGHNVGNQNAETPQPTPIPSKSVTLNFDRFKQLSDPDNSSDEKQSHRVDSPADLEPYDSLERYADKDVDMSRSMTPPPPHVVEEQSDSRNNRYFQNNDATDKSNTLDHPNTAPPSPQPTIQERLLRMSSEKIETDEPSSDAENLAHWIPSRGAVGGASFPMFSTGNIQKDHFKKDKGKQRADLAQAALRKKRDYDETMRQHRRAATATTTTSSSQPTSGGQTPSTTKTNTDDSDDFIKVIRDSPYLSNDAPSRQESVKSVDDDLQEEAQRLLLGQLETALEPDKSRNTEQQQKSQGEEKNDEIQALCSRLQFEAEIDHHQGVLAVVEHIRSILPFHQWSFLRSLDLSYRKLTTVIDLETILPSLETFVVSNNAISRMPRLPQTLRILKAKSNRLTDISSFQNLRNLQYLDICNNAIDNFEGINPLYHLRTLHAENNKISSCAPFRNMKGLIHLNLRSNAIRHLGFRKGRLEFLETLDVSFNRIDCLEAIEGLPSLKVLNLDHNDVKWIQLEEPAAKLKILRMSYNRLKTFDGSFFPDLRTLYLDDNQILRIVGLSCTSRLDSFSLRDQGGQKVEINLRYLRGARKLYLSGNALKQLDTVVDFFALEYLELCAVQIEELPSDFSRQVPNLGALYLSHNYLRDIHPLRKLRHLQKLVLIDNRLQSLSETVETIRTLEKLHHLDLRQNPISAKLYPPIKTPEAYQSVLAERISRYLANEHDRTWMSRDAEFCQNLPSHWQERRATYRALFVKCCPKLKTLDGIAINETDVASAETIVAQLQQKQHIGTSHQ